MAQKVFYWYLVIPALGLPLLLASCGSPDQAKAKAPITAQEAVTVGVIKVGRKTLERQLTVSSELVPFQEIDVYAKEAGYVKNLYVDYGSHVKQGQLMATLEIPELEATIQEDQGLVNSQRQLVTHAQHELTRVEAQRRVLHLEYTRLNGVAESQPGLVAQQEVDDVQGRDLAAAAQVEASKANLATAQSNLQAAESKLEHDKALYAYSRITAPFTGVVTQRYANFGTLMQAGTNSSTQAMPLVKLSQEDLYRLYIPVPESYVPYIKIGDPVDVRVPALNHIFPGKVARFAYDINDSTRTMHTEVDVKNPTGGLMPGMYAEATLTLNRKPEVLAVPLQAVERDANQASVFIVNPSHTIEERQVKLGVETASYVEVESGVQPGDMVVVSDRSGLKPGQQVHPHIVALASEQSTS